MSNQHLKLTSHVLNTTIGKPGSGIEVKLFERSNAATGWTLLATKTTDADGRCLLLQKDAVTEGPCVFKVTFEVGGYFKTLGEKSFYPYVDIVFEVEDPQQHFHIPLLLSNYGYTTYRGS